MKYFHQLTDQEYMALAEGVITLRGLLDGYKQPDWCDYPEALHPYMGCWALTDKFLRLKISHEYCNNCPCYESNTGV